MNKRLCMFVLCTLALVALMLYSPDPAVSEGLFQSPIPPPSNDDFDNATEIASLPYTAATDTFAATWAPDDPQNCTSNGSVWYVFTPAYDMTIEAHTFGSYYDTVLSVYTGMRGALTMVPDTCNDDWNGLQSRVLFPAVAGIKYYFLIGYCCGHGGDGGGSLAFAVHEVLAPANDDWANAIPIFDLPFTQEPDTTVATAEPDEPVPSCASEDPPARTVWYAFTPPESGSFWAYAWNPYVPSVAAAYTGDALASLTEVGCGCCWGEWLILKADAGTTYYFQVGNLGSQGGSLQFHLEVIPPLVVDMGFSPEDPSVFDTVQFHNWSYDPIGIGFESQTWDFGDGSSSTEWSPTHRYTADGDYTVQLTVTTYDGRTASTSRSVPVRTHDVAISKFSAPKAASAGQTRSIVVGVNSRRYPERVEVMLLKSIPGGYQWVGSLVQSVPVRPSNRTTDFKFSYTFTGDDATTGKVTFKAVATIIDARDALPADNEAVAAPTKINH